MATSIQPLALIALVSFLLLCPVVDATRMPTINSNLHSDTNTKDGKQNIARRSVTVDLQRNPNYAPNGPTAYARALKKWGAEVPGDLADVLAVMRGDGVFFCPRNWVVRCKYLWTGRLTQKRTDGDVGADTIRNDREYVSQVGFGTPLQWLNVDLDTGSADV